MTLRQEPFYLPLSGGDRFCIWRAPTHGASLRGLVLHAPAFAEEMNKCRRMTAWAARDLAEQGFGVLQIDLHGCGDSGGDFGDATWEQWVEDLVDAAAWLRKQSKTAPLWIWGVRAGALLAAAVASRLEPPLRLVVWQPVVSGRQHLTQFLRLALAADMLSKSSDRQGTKQLRDRLAGGEPLEIAGYLLSPALALGLEQASFTFPTERVSAIVWLEVAAPSGSMSPVATKSIDTLREKGVRVQASSVGGPSFWQTVEVEDCAALVESTRLALAVEDDREHLRDTVLL